MLPDGLLFELSDKSIEFVHQGRDIYRAPSSLGNLVSSVTIALGDVIIEEGGVRADSYGGGYFPVKQSDQTYKPEDAKYEARQQALRDAGLWVETKERKR